MSIIETIQYHGWAIEGVHAEKKWEFEDFSQAHAFVNTVATLAEQQNHHPDIAYGWGYVHLRLTTHDEGGLSEKDVMLIEAIETS